MRRPMTKAELAADNLKLREVLERVQWIDFLGVYRCVGCGDCHPRRDYADGRECHDGATHFDGCELNAVLRGEA